MAGFSRRRVLAIGGAGAAGLAGLGTLPFHDWAARAGRTRLRYSAASAEGKEMLKSYAKGVAAMKALPEGKPMSWTFQFYTHWVPNSGKDAEITRIYGAEDSADRMAALAMWETCRGHSGGDVSWADEEQWFTVWHRMYVFFFEEIIRKASGDADFTLPFWDYTTEGENIIPVEFTLPDDPLYGALYMPNRNPGVNEREKIDCGDNSCLDHLVFGNTGNVNGFNTSLDQSPHGTVHVNVGNITNMGNVPTAANDPVFWLHHSNVDRIWASWNRAGGGRSNPTDPDWLDKQFTFSDGENLVLAATRDFTSTEQLDYAYSTYLTPPGEAAVPVALLGGKQAELLRVSAKQDPGPVPLGSGPVTVDRALPSPGGGLRSALKAGSGPQLYLILQDLQFKQQPGTVYDVHVSITGPDGAEEEILAGQINFFNARQKGSEEPQNAGLSFSFDVTGLLDSHLHTEGPLPQAAVRITPAGDPDGAAMPVIGRVFFSAE